MSSDESSNDESIKDILDDKSDDLGNKENQGLRKLMNLTKAIKKKKV